MLTQLPTLETPRNLRRERRLWHDGRATRPRWVARDARIMTSAVGCRSATRYSIASFCCHNAEDCDAVCQNKPEEFARRVREISGFSFENVPRAPRLAAPPCPPSYRFSITKAEGRSRFSRRRSACPCIA